MGAAQVGDEGVYTVAGEDRVKMGEKVAADVTPTPKSLGVLVTTQRSGKILHAKEARPDDKVHTTKSVVLVVDTNVRKRRVQGARD